jgi:hypothetical protein
MATIQQIFGSGATQSLTTLTISKADLDALVPGYSPSADDSGDKLLAAIAYATAQTATESARGTDSTRRTTCTYAGYDVVSRSGLPEGDYDRRDLFTLVWYSPQPTAGFSLV